MSASPDHGTRIELQKGWQGGPASLTVEVDENMLDGGSVGTAVLLLIETPTDCDAETELGLGSGKLVFPAGQGRLEFMLCASLEQAEALRDCLSWILAGEPREWVSERRAQEGARVRELLDRRCYAGAGTKVTNCVRHAGYSLTERPADCALCATDVASRLRDAFAINDWLNTWKDDAEALIRELAEPKKKGASRSR